MDDVVTKITTILNNAGNHTPDDIATIAVALASRDLTGSDEDKLATVTQISTLLDEMKKEFPNCQSAIDTFESRRSVIMSEIEQRKKEAKDLASQQNTTNTANTMR